MQQLQTLRYAFSSLGMIIIAPGSINIEHSAILDIRMDKITDI
jgi:hypothetical protein